MRRATYPCPLCRDGGRVVTLEAELEPEPPPTVVDLQGACAHAAAFGALEEQPLEEAWLLTEAALKRGGRRGGLTRGRAPTPSPRNARDGTAGKADYAGRAVDSRDAPIEWMIARTSRAGCWPRWRNGAATRRGEPGEGRDRGPRSDSSQRP